MFSLSTARHWGHLITFDSIQSTLRESLEGCLLNGGRQQDDRTPTVRITDAGRCFVRFVCPHFEYFAVRFSQKSEPLFSPNNLNYCHRGKFRFIFELTLNRVCSAVEKCCDNLDKLQKSVFIERMGMSENEIINSNYVYTNHESNYSSYHAERIIHQHINYIDSYRMYLVNNPDRSAADRVEINRKIIPFLQRYLKLLKKYDYFGEKSKTLYEELSDCINYIEKEDYSICDLPVSRRGYDQLTERKENKHHG